MSSRVFFFIGILLLSSTAFGKPPYVKKATWAETMLANRAEWLQQKTEAKPGYEMESWWTTGPLPVKSFEEALPPEKDLPGSLERKAEAGNPLWAQHPEWDDGLVVALPSGQRSHHYLYRKITVDKATKLKVGLGSDDGLAVWLNGKQLLAKDVARGATANQERLKLDLQPGENHLLLKIHNRGGQCGFFFGTGRENLESELWKLIRKDFSLETVNMEQECQGRHLKWFQADGGTAIERRMLEQVFQGKETIGADLKGRFRALTAGNAPATDPAWLDLFAEAVGRRQIVRDEAGRAEAVKPEAVRMAVEDLARSFGDRYPGAGGYLERLEKIEKTLATGGDAAAGARKALLALQEEALLANPLIDFESLLVIKRNAHDPKLGLPQNWQGNCALPRTGFDNEIATLKLEKAEAEGRELTTLYRPPGGKFVGDLDLHFDGDRMLFSMPGSQDRWQIWEIGKDGGNLRQVTPGEYPDVDNYDACYLPGGRILFGSTRCFQGVPCVGGGNTVANLFLLDAGRKNIRQLTFDQDHNWCPTMLADGRVLYSRWEYTDTPHYFTRLLFHMNPDGTGQMEHYGSNSYWPNSIFYARPIPDHPTKLVAVISGHHGEARMGELLVFDPEQGRREADGAVQRIPGHREEVTPTITDQLVREIWPRFLHPFPLSDRHFLVSCQPAPESLWGIYLADTFDNLVLIRQEPGYALFEPVPLRQTSEPAVVPDKVNPDSREAVVYLADIYRGPGLAGVPRGTVKKLRVIEYHYAYPKMGGHISIGIDGPWDVHRIRGTVPVEPDGSASFLVPANMPLAIQPLDAEGKALQVMRSWFTAMPGEVLSCVGCHESQNEGPPSMATLASQRPPSKIDPWHGPARGFSFVREIQPVLDKNCAGCHDGARSEPNLVDTGKGWKEFTNSYIALHPYVRRPGPESDYHLQVPCEWHADTSQLVQMLQKGHHGVELGSEDWDRLFTWIDLNVPDHGTWGEHREIAGDYHARRLAMRTAYANRPEDPEVYPAPPAGRPAYVPPRAPAKTSPAAPEVTGWPFTAEEAKRRQESAGRETAEKIDLGHGVQMELALVPAGKFVIGDSGGCDDEQNCAAVEIAEPFYMGKYEITNAQYALFDPVHDSGYISQYNKDHSDRGKPVNGANQPVCRISWERAVKFCEWLSEKTGRRFLLPTEAQWEYACRAGAETPLNFGSVETDFSRLANLADSQLNELTIRDSPDWIPCRMDITDGACASADVGRYLPNAWGLCDMHGNVAEWTRSLYRPYPYADGDGRNDLTPSGKRVVRGGSFHDRPGWARSSFRLAYPDWRPVFNVGFRVVCEAGKEPLPGRDVVAK